MEVMIKSCVDGPFPIKYSYMREKWLNCNFAVKSKHQAKEAKLDFFPPAYEIISKRRKGRKKESAEQR